MGFLLNSILILIFVNIFQIFVFVSSSSAEEKRSANANISQGYFTNNIPAYDFIYPLKVSEDGEQLSHLVTNYYVDDITQRKKREINEEKLRYDLPLSNGKTLKLELSPNYDIAAPSLIIEHKNIETEFNVGKTRIRRASTKKCYYRGKVLNEPNSDVAISTCRGLAGFIRSNEGEYFIEPSSKYDPFDGNHPHILFKKTDQEKNLDAGSSISRCGNRVINYKLHNDPTQKENYLKELHKDNLTREDDISLDDDEENDNNESTKPDDSDNNNNDEETQEQENDENNEQQQVSTKKMLFKKQKENKKLKSKQHKCDDNSNECDKDSDLSGSITTEQYLQLKDDFNKKNDQYKKIKEKLALHHKKISNKVDDNSNSGTNNDDSNKIENDDDNNENNDDYDYDQDIDKSNKNTKKFKNEDSSSDKSNLQPNNKELDTQSPDETNTDEVKDNNDGKKNKDEKFIKFTSSKIKKKQNNDNTKVFEVNPNDIRNGFFNHINKVKKDIVKEVKLVNDKKIKLSENEIDSKNSNSRYDHGSKFSSKQIHERKIELPVNDGKQNYDSIPADNYFKGDDNCDQNTFYDNNSNSSLRRDSADPSTYENPRVNSKRHAEYQSCKLPAECKNKTECVWDLRLLIVVSYLFSQRHKDIDLETFILTIINMINRNFQDSSLGMIINIKLVRMVFIEYKMDELDEDKNKLEDLFENFCLFQYRINPFRSQHPNHHDIAVYIISTNLCNVNEMYGLSNQASLCHCQKSCIVSVDEGLLLGNIITHQLGHSLGADHNVKGAEQYCDPSGKKIYFHMDPMITMNATQWSKCAAYAIRRFVRTQGAKCLKHMTVDLNFDWAMQMLPGQIYNPVQQCSLNFHMPLLPCYNGDFCKNLYCQINERQCISSLVAPADGTACATQMWCVRGYCVTQGRYPEMTNGEWNTWGPWSPCSRSCGGGAQQSHRMCNNPPPSRGGRFCIGKRTRYRICNIDRCDHHSIGFREQQCRRTEDNPFRGQYYSWKPFYNNFEYVECSLLCESETGIVAVRRLLVEDGTSCKPGTKNVCIAGTCMDVGCDWGINSRAVVDACGLCHGNGTECKIIQGLYSERNNSGYIPFMKVPRRSGMIYVRELNPSDVTFVVSSFNTGHLYLNTFGETDKKPRTGDVDFGNSRGLYSVFGGMERIFIPGPIDEDLVFFAKFKKDRNPGIRYQFALPEVDPNYIPTYSWQFIDWETCSDACGGGQQKSRAKCVEDVGGIVENIYCSEASKPHDVVRSCNEFPCLPKWWVGSWSECVTVGNEEVRYRSVLCMRTRDPNSLRNEILKEKYCCDEEKPDPVRRCNETYGRCQEKSERCDLIEDFPNIINLNELDINFADIKDNSEKNEAQDYETRNNFQLVNSEDEKNGIMSQNIAKVNDVEEDIDRFFDNVYDENAQPPGALHPHIGLIESNKKEGLLKIVNAINTTNNEKHKTKETNITDDVISPANVSALVSLKEPLRKIMMKKFRDGKTAFHHKFISKNESHPNRVSKISKVDTGAENDAKNTSPLAQSKPGCGVSVTEVPTTCQIVFTCKTENKDICNITECNVPSKCPSPSPPLKTIVDQIILNEYKLAIIPTVCEKHMYRPADHDYEIFHDTTVWAVGAEANKTILYGKDALNFLLSVRKNMSRTPFVFQAEN